MKLSCIPLTHKWKYTVDRNDRICSKCGKSQYCEVVKRNLYGINESGKMKMVNFYSWKNYSNALLKRHEK